MRRKATLVPDRMGERALWDYAASCLMQASMEARQFGSFRAIEALVADALACQRELRLRGQQLALYDPAEVVRGPVKGG